MPLRIEFNAKHWLTASIVAATAWWLAAFFIQPTVWWDVFFALLLLQVGFAYWWLSFKAMKETFKPAPLPTDPLPSEPLTADESRAMTQVANDQSGIRVFASAEDAAKHGWSFDQPAGRLDDVIIHRVASRDGLTWLFDGLVTSVNAIVPPDMRVFGKLRYRLVKDKPTEAESINRQPS